MVGLTRVQGRIKVPNVRATRRLVPGIAKKNRM